MSEAPAPERDPAIGLIEMSSIARGVTVADAMAKTAPIGSLYAGSVHPGKYLVLVSGDTASVEEAMTAGMAVAASRTVDTIFLPDIDPGVVTALTEPTSGSDLGDEAVGIVETETVAALIGAADARFYYYDYHKVSEKKPDAFLAGDFKRLSKASQKKASQNKAGQN